MYSIKQQNRTNNAISLYSLCTHLSPPPHMALFFNINGNSECGKGDISLEEYSSFKHLPIGFPCSRHCFKKTKIFIELLPYAKYCAKYFTYINLFKPLTLATIVTHTDGGSESK